MVDRLIRGVSVALVAALIASPVAAASCVKPAQPQVPDKSSMDAATRNAVTAQIEAYVGAMNVYLACLEQSDARARAEAERIISEWTSPAVTDIQVVTD